MGALTRWYDDILTAALLAGAGGVVLIVLAFSTSVHGTAVRPVDYTHHGTWSYQAPVPDNALFSSGKVETGEPIFSALSQEATFAFSYSGSSAETADVTGTGRLVAKLYESSGWTWEIPLGPVIRFQGPSILLAGRLDLPDIAEVIQRFKEQTGAGRTAFEVHVLAEVDSSVIAAGTVTQSLFDSALVFKYDSLGLVPVSVDGEITPVKTDAIRREVRVGNTIPLLIWRMDVRLARVLGLSLLELAVLGFIAVIVARMDPRVTAVRQPALDERRTVSVRAFPFSDKTGIVEVGSLDELARIAQFEQAMVLTRQERGTAEYAVVGAGAVYVFRELPVIDRRWAAA